MTSSDTMQALSGEDYLTSPVREDLYVLLSYLLVQPPTGDLMRQLADLSWEIAVSPALAASLDTLRAAATACSHGAVEREFDDLFIGLGRGEMMPYASWYAEKLLMGAPLVRLRSDLAKLGVRRRVKVYEPEDHVAALCETMALIIRSPQISPEQQKSFFFKHMHPWMVRFFKDLQQASSARFYRAVGGLGEHFFWVEKLHLQPK